MYNFYHVSTAFPGVPKVRDLEPAFSDAGDDWIRLSNFYWLLWTPKTSREIYNRLVPFLDPGDQFIITEMNSRNTAGRLPQWAWDWVNSKAGLAIANPLLLPPPPMPWQ
jgi:hypothetical protein